MIEWTPTTDRHPLSDEMSNDALQPAWITHREAAALMTASGFRVNEKRLRLRDAAGNYRHFPELERRREGRTITLCRRQIEAWIADRAAQARAQAEQARRRTAPVATGIPAGAFDEVKDFLRQSGSPRAARALERIGY